MLDTLDHAIIAILQGEGRITNVELASRVGLTPGPTLARVNKLEAAGLIKGYAAIIDREAMGFEVTVFVSIILRDHTKEANEQFLNAVCRLPEVLEVHHIAGEEDYLLKVIAESPSTYEKFLVERLSTVADLQRVKTTFVLSSPKCTTAVPVEATP